MPKILNGMLALVLGGCSVAPQPPPQPTPAAIVTAGAALAQISADPITTWRVGVYVVRSACHAYLNEAAARAAAMSSASTGLGLSGTAAAGFLASGGNPVGAALATGLASLGQSFLAAYQASGAIPYTTATTTMIEGALDAEETSVEQRLPTSVAQAASYVDDLWWWCSPGGYAELMMKSALTAQVSASSSPGFGARSAAPSARPRVLVNGQ